MRKHPRRQPPRPLAAAPLTLGFLLAVLVAVPLTSAASPAPPEGAAPPSAEATTPPSAEAEGEATTEAPTALPKGAVTEPLPDPEGSAPPAPQTAPPPEDLVAPSLTDSSTPSTPRPVDPVDDDEVLSDREAEAQAAHFHELYRPAHNPGRFNLVVTSNYTILGSNDHHLSGRFFGLHADLGQSWNSFGYALSLRANVGNLSLQEDRKVQALALVGGGPSLNLGRLALLQRGYLDLRVGYDFFYAPARALVEGLEARSIAPHGPRLQVNMGLMVNPGINRRFFHGVGATVSYQALVGAFSGDLPFTGMLSLGLSYWMG